MNQFAASENYILQNGLYANRKVSGALNSFWLGFIIYTSVYSILISPSINVNFWNKIQLVGLGLILISAFRLVKFKIENKNLQFLFFIYLLWNLFIIARGIQFNYQFIYLSILDAWFGIPIYFVPIILLLPQKIYYLKKVFAVITIMGIIFLGLSALFRNELLTINDDTDTNKYLAEYLSRILSVPTGFLLLTYIYHSKKRMFLAFAITFITLAFALVRARRAIIFMEISYLLGFYFIYLYASKAKVMVLIISLIMISVLAYGGVKFYDKYKNNIFSNLTERIDEDTRTGVEVCLYDDMTSKDWIIGKGMSGTYYCPGIDKGFFTDYRGMIETDYLNIILKGGIVSLGLLLLITIPAVVKGIFYSKNLLSKAAGVWILMWLSDLYPTVVDTFALHYALVWICIGICYSSEIRNMSEDRVMELLSNKNNKQTALV
ncbi:MAG: hypothetical protein JST17_14835 [Bacteroidetes bacterium]|nr:hypothetical protein [Bacteroidota bacterium]